MTVIWLHKSLKQNLCHLDAGERAGCSGDGFWLLVAGSVVCVRSVRAFASDWKTCVDCLVDAIRPSFPSRTEKAVRQSLEGATKYWLSGFGIILLWLFTVACFAVAGLSGLLLGVKGNDVVRADRGVAGAV